MTETFSNNNVTPKGATETSRAANTELLNILPFADRRDFEDAKRGFVAPLPNGGVIKNEKGLAVWDMARFSFINEEASAPDTVNPSLWRQSQLAIQGGLYKVVEGLYQVRNADLSNITIYEGNDPESR